MILSGEELIAQTGGSSLDVPQTRLAPLGSTLPSVPPAGSMLGATNPPSSGYSAPLSTPFGSSAGSFDPYAGAPASGFVQPVPSGTYAPGSMAVVPPSGLFAPASPPVGTGPVYGGLASQPPPLVGGSNYGTSSIFSTPFGGPPVAIPSSGYAGPLFGGSAYGGAVATNPTLGAGFGPGVYPSGAPSTLFPGGIFSRPGAMLPKFNPTRLIQRGRFRHTYLADESGADDLEINTTDVAFAFAFPRFLFSNQPLFVAPSFSLNLFDGPDGSLDPTVTADLPGETYDAFVDFAWQSDPNQIFGAEFLVGVGVFSEFDVINSDSLRVRGRGMGTFRLTPASTFKLGVYYYDRVDVKLLPAGGIFWQPNPFTKVDLFFPQPRYSRFLSTVGTQDVWWYVAGDYGGGSWTIDRAGAKGEERVDVNDIRLMTGLEWGRSDLIRAGQRTWFFDFGYVFEREIKYENFSSQGDNLSLGDAWMARLGIGY